jgi:pimeloyl-ACP methyl ester carboxylesterase
MEARRWHFSGLSRNALPAASSASPPETQGVATMTMVRANGWDFYCESVGSGPDLVFIHGEIHGIDYWEHQIADLSRDHRCLIYERRGHRRTGLATSRH